MMIRIECFTNWIAYNLKESKLSHDEIRNIAESVKIKDKVSLTNQRYNLYLRRFS